MNKEEIIANLTEENQLLKIELEKYKTKLKETPISKISKEINRYLLHNKPDEKSFKEFIKILELTRIPMNTFTYEELHEGYLKEVKNK